MIENEDYELIPSDNENWNVRILKGIYNETVITYGSLRIQDDPINDVGILKFDYDIVSTPDESLDSNDEDFKNFCGDVLVSIIERAVEKDQIIKREVE